MAGGYLIDTDILSYFLKGQPAVLRHFRNRSEESDLMMSLISYYEILRGLKSASLPHKEHQFREWAEAWSILPLDVGIGEIAASLYAELSSVGTPLPDADLLIAATALRHGLTLVTNNTKHFSRIASLHLDNWAK